MLKHYKQQTITDDELDQLLEQARRDPSSTCSGGPILVVAEDEDEETDEAFDAWAMNTLDSLAYDDTDETTRGTPTVDGYDMCEAIGVLDGCNLMLGTVFDSPNRGDRVVELDADAIADVKAWAILTALPDWVRWRLQRLVEAGAVLDRGAANRSGRT